MLSLSTGLRAPVYSACATILGTVPPSYVLFGGTVPPSYVLFGGTVPPSYILFGGTVPPNTFLQEN